MFSMFSMNGKVYISLYIFFYQTKRIIKKKDYQSLIVRAERYIGKTVKVKIESPTGSGILVEKKYTFRGSFTVGFGEPNEDSTWKDVVCQTVATLEGASMSEKLEVFPLAFVIDAIEKDIPLYCDFFLNKNS